MNLRNREEQKALFADMLDLAGELSRPVVVHSREADADTLEHLGRYAAANPDHTPGVLHCFTGSLEFARALLDIGMYISFSGILTFRNAEDLRQVARQIPEDRILVETDSPYLAPVPLRGKPNQPAYVKHVAACLAELRGWAPDDCARITSENASRLFGWN